MDGVALLIVLLVVSAFFSGAEIAFVTANKLKIEIKARKKNPAAISAMYFINKPQIFFSTILIGNTIVLIIFTSLFSITFEHLGELSILIFSTLIILIFGELLPKYFSREISNKVVFITSIPLRIFSVLAFPLLKIFTFLSGFFTKRQDLKEGNINYVFSKEDIQLLVKESHEAGIVNKSENSIISKVFALGEQRVYEAMRPRTDIVGVEITSSIEDVIETFIESGYSKLPVYEDNLDNIKGVIFAYDLFNEPQNITHIIRDVIFVPDTKKSDEMLKEFLEKHASVAIVIDEFGGTAGIITLEDLMEELFGEIEDEYDVQEDVCKEIKEGLFIISGKVEIDFINEKFNLNIPLGDYETIAGYIISNLGRIPKQGEKFNLLNTNILILRSNQTKIDLIKLQKNIES